MRGFWYKIWQSPARATLAGALLSILIASVLYCFNWHTFYDTRKNMEESKALLISKDISTLAIATNAAPGDDAELKKALVRYFEPRPQYIEVSRYSEGNPKWTLSSDKPVDTSRTVIEETFTIDVAAGPDSKDPLFVTFKMGIRPLFFVALTRAWSFSILDYFDDPENWWSDALYNRSIPLYGYLITILFVGFGTIRAIYKNQQELIRLEQETQDISADLDIFRDLHSKEIAAVHQQIEHTQHQRDQAIFLQKQLTEEISSIEEEYLTLMSVSPAREPDQAKLQDAADRKTQVTRALRNYNAQVNFYENELRATRSELGAAEQLLQEVEERRDGLSTKLQDRNREIRKLKKLIEKAHTDKYRLQRGELHPSKIPPQVRQEWEESQNRIEEQLGHWIKNGDQIHSNFSKHCKSTIVEEQFAKIDPDFVNRYFTHVNNLEYERGGRRLIRVVTDAPDGSEAAAGKLIIAIDDDIGRTLGLRFETRKDAPSPVFVGFVLALLLRAKCKDFRMFAIRTR